MGNMCSVNKNRNLSLETHGAVEVLAGLTTLLAPVVLGFAPAGLILSVALGTLLVGMALTLTGSRGSIIVWHRDFDSLFLIATAVAALALALAGEWSASIFFAALVAVQSALHLGTRYAGGT